MNRSPDPRLQELLEAALEAGDPAPDSRELQRIRSAWDDLLLLDGVQEAPPAVALPLRPARIASRQWALPAWVASVAAALALGWFLGGGSAGPPAGPGAGPEGRARTALSELLARPGLAPARLAALDALAPGAGSTGLESRDLDTALKLAAGDASTNIRIRALQVLEAYGSQARVQALAGSLLQADLPDPLILACLDLVALAGITPAAGQVERLATGTTSPMVRSRAAWALGRLGVLSSPPSKPIQGESL